MCVCGGGGGGGGGSLFCCAENINVKKDRTS